MKQAQTWSTADIPDLTGKYVIVTGGNIGLGFKSSLELARKGAHVTIACRSVQKGEAAREKILNEYPKAQLVVMPLDLTDLESVEQFAEAYRDQYKRLDVLLCNAGVVNLPSHQLTESGIEMHMATNHFGHFALTLRVLPLLEQTPGARIVVVSSGGYKMGKPNFDDLNWTRREYKAVQSYADSKLANLWFAKALNARLSKKGASCFAVCAHPGLTGTERQQSIGVGGKLSKWLASPVEKGMLHQLRAAVDPKARSGDFYGPRYGLLGPVVKLKLNVNTLDSTEAERLWAVSESVTGVKC